MANPILEFTDDPSSPMPLVELKQHLVFYVPDPPGPVTARRVYDAYLRAVGDVFRNYRSTVSWARLEAWDAAARIRFETVLLPELRKTVHWGYGFSDAKPVDSRVFMFHGFRPFTEPEMASFFRFEFDWQVDAAFLRSLALDMMSMFPVCSGYGGYLLQGRPSSKYEEVSFERIYALARRYWGCDVEEIELSARELKRGYKCLSWLTVIGEPFRTQFQKELAQAKLAAFDFVDGPFATLLQVSDSPTLGDRNVQADLKPYFDVARALLPMQIKSHEPFWSTRWEGGQTMAWLQRFTHGWPT
ncbi:MULTISPECIES: type VI immunity family protein [unclassified Caballeronia]|jgi:hypothetical protein|uniref:type VI immunity family protein n=2 Tax=Burkholderiaceae TaxID=119060 RepID=UPI002028F09A|nr:MULTISPECIES: type VI immunity family protein [unclassified Caballeronia]